MDGRQYDALRVLWGLRYGLTAADVAKAIRDGDSRRSVDTASQQLTRLCRDGYVERELFDFDDRDNAVRYRYRLTPAGCRRMLELEDWLAEREG